MKIKFLQLFFQFTDQKNSYCTFTDIQPLQTSHRTVFIQLYSRRRRIYNRRRRLYIQRRQLHIQRR